MKRIALIGVILGILLVADGIYMVVSKYNGGETQAWNLPDGWISIISAAVLLLASLIAFVLSARSTTPPLAVMPEVEAEQA